MGDKTRGLYDKFSVERKDHSSNHPNCEYFVLDLTHDPYALPALSEYAIFCKDEFPLLSHDIELLIEKFVNRNREEK